MAEPTKCIVVCVDDSDRYDAAVAAAIERAKSDGARLILYDVSAPGMWTSPRPNIWAGEGEAAVYDKPLDPVALEKLGRHQFAVQVERARAKGVTAFGWLPKDSGGPAVAAYAASQGADLILLPADLEPPEIAEHLRGGTTEESTQGLQVEVIG